MRHPDIDYMMVMERRQDDLAAAALHRFVKEAESGKPFQTDQKQHAIFDRLGQALTLWLARLLSRTGERMLAWSCRLKYRYTMITEDAAETRPSPCTS